MTQKQILTSILIINIISIGSTMTMLHNPYRYYTPEDKIRYYYPDHTNAISPKKYTREFKKALSNNLFLLETENASEKTLKMYATDCLNTLEKNKQKIIQRQENK